MSCPHCNRWGEECKPAQCAGCGSWQCHGNGSRNGRCRVCLYGALEGWSRGWSKGCGYKGCEREAVFFGVPRVKRCCAECAPRVKIRVGFGENRETEPLDVFARRMADPSAQHVRRYRRETYAEWAERKQQR